MAAFVQTRQAMRHMPFAIGGTTADQQKNISTVLKNVPDAQSLFGGETLCECEHSRSVYSPSAYLVDLLDLLDFGSAAKKKQRQFSAKKRRIWSWVPPKGKNPVDVLLARRPDIAELPLTPENTLTPLPYIDLVNEILEAYVTNSSASFSTADVPADVLKAVPQFVNNDAYKILSNSLYPLSLPFHRPLEVARSYVSHLGVTRLELLEAFRKDSKAGHAILAESLSCSIAEFLLIANESQQPWALYGLPRILGNGVNWSEVLKLVPNFLQRTGIEYAELVDLLKTRFLGRSTIKLEQDTPGCDVNKISIVGADEAWYGETARFLRLKRHLAISVADLDRCMVSVDAQSISSKSIAQVVLAKKIARKINCDLIKLLSLWGAIDTFGDDSLYKKLFLNSMVSWSTGNKNAFSLNTQKFDLAHPGNDIGAFKSAIQAGMQITDKELRAIIDDLSDRGVTLQFNLAGLSAIYRYALLSQSLSVSINDLLRILHWVGPAAYPFTNHNPLPAWHFIIKAQKVTGSVFKPEVLDYLFRNKISPPSNPGPTRYEIWNAISSIRQRLTEAIAETVMPDQISLESIKTKLLLAFSPQIAARTIAILNPESKIDLSKRKAFLQKYYKEIYKDSGEIITLLFGDNNPEKPEGEQEDADSKKAKLSKTFENRIRNFLALLLPWLRNKRQHGVIVEALADALSLKQDIVRYLIDEHCKSELVSHNVAVYDFNAVLGTGLKGSYFSSVDMTGNAAHVQIDSTMQLNWTNGNFPIQPSQNGVSVRWEGLLLPGETKEYTFSIKSDGKVSLVLRDGNTVHQLIQGQSENSVKEYTSKLMKLEKTKLYQIKLEYRSARSPEQFILFWSTSPSSKDIVPASNLFSPDILSSFDPIFESYIRLFKSAAYINGFELTKKELVHLVNAGPRLDFNAFSTRISDNSSAVALFNQWEVVYDFAKFRKSLPEHEKSIIDILESSESNEKKLKDLSDITGWSNATVSELAGPHSFALSTNDLAVPESPETEWKLLWLQEGLRVAKRLGVSASTLIEWTQKEPDSDQAIAIIQAVKQRYDRKQWLDIAKDINNLLRKKQRDALVAYLIPRMADKGIVNKNQLFEYFLIDVEMASCMMTSRVKQAISSVQLFIQRILLNLEEPQIHPSTVDSAEWKWLKNYRVWEANRKVFLYPENWIEPELRDDKSPLFTSVEKELMQAELTDDNVERAYRAYLKGLDEVARLQIKGFWHQTELHSSKKKKAGFDVNIYHFFGRTFSQPHKYFYRQFVNGTKWTPWTAIDVDIQGNHIVPTIVSGRLTVFWLVLEEKSRPASTFSDPTKRKGKIEQPKMDWEIRLEFTEQQSNEWLPKRVSEGSIRFPQLAPSQSFTCRLKKRTAQGDVVLDVFLEIPGKASQRTSQMLRIGQFIKEGCRGQIIGLPEAAVQMMAMHHQTVKKVPGKSDLKGNDTFSHPDNTRVSGMGFSGPSQDQRIVKRYTTIKKVGKKKKRVQQKSTKLVKSNLTIRNKSAQNGFQPVLNSLKGSATQPNRSYEVLPPARLKEAQLPKPYPFIFQDTYNTFFVRVITRLVRYQRVMLIRTSPAQNSKRWRIRFKSRGLVMRTPGESEEFFAVESANDLLERRKNRKRKKTKRNSKRSRPMTRRKVGASRRRSSTRTPKKQPVSYVRKRVNSIKIQAQYHFINFQHPFVCTFIRSLNQGGLDAFLHTKSQVLSLDKPVPFKSGMSRNQWKTLNDKATYFHELYQPGKAVRLPYPRMNVDFTYGGTYGLYNWELFFHIPLLIASRLTKEHKHDQAQKWFHYLFDPTSSDQMPAPMRFWKFLPFKTNSELTRATQLMQLLAYTGKNSYIRTRQRSVVRQIEEWAKNPFNPHAIARLRIVAYQKSVVMKYIDNLIEWGDILFRKDTIESTNEGDTVVYPCRKYSWPATKAHTTHG